MTTATLTLTDFLLARFDEDEAGARAARFAADWPKVANAAASGSNADAGLHVLFAGSPNRVLAECEAKREALRLLAEADAHSVSVDTIEISDYVYRDVLRALALPYAEHPDYREEWRA